MRVLCRSSAASSSRWLVSSFSRMARWLACKWSRVASISAQNSARLTSSGLAALGLRSFFTNRNAEPTAPAIAAQPSPEIARAEAIGELRLVFIVTGNWLLVTGYWLLITDSWLQVMWDAGLPDFGP